MKGLGNRIKILRKERGITLLDIAKRSGIDQATLSRIENGKMTGTLSSHMKIADVLGIRLPDLYAEVLNKADEIQEKVVREKFEAFSHSEGCVAELLTTGILKKKMVPLLLKIKGGGGTTTEEYPATTERFIYVLKGSVEVNLGDEKKMLREGESTYFSAAVSHHFRNPLKTETRCISIMTPASL